jgi:hypothetical protein
MIYLSIQRSISFSSKSTLTGTTPLNSQTCPPARLDKTAVHFIDKPAASAHAAMLITVSPAPLTSATARSVVG